MTLQEKEIIITIGEEAYQTNRYAKVMREEESEFRYLKTATAHNTL